MKFNSTSTKTSSKPMHQSYPSDSNVKTSRLNKGSDKNWRGKRGGAKMKKGY
jgi:hypothetical protein